MARVLIVDDSATIRMTLGLILRKEHKTVTAVNGQDALDKLAQNIVDIIVSDIHMPVMDGHELVRCLRADERYRQLPIIMLTQSSSPEDQVEAKSSGADVYLSKPVSSNELLATINRFAQYDSSATKPLPPLPPIDRDMLLPLMGNDETELEGFLAEALLIFKTEAAEQLKLLEEAVKESNLEEVEQISHRLRGSSGSLGASRLVELCFALESAAKQGVMDGMALKLVEIQVEVARIRVYTDTQFPKA